MTFSDYILDLALIGIVFLQIRGRRLTARSLLLPIAIVAYVASQYLKAIPTAGNDLWLIGICTAVGIALGAGAGLTTRVRTGDAGEILAKAGATAAVLWVLGVGFRFAFQLYATHGGEGTIARFSAHHAITTSTAWVDALVLMALCEALARTFVLAGRAYRMSPSFLSARPLAAIMGAGEQIG